MLRKNYPGVSREKYDLLLNKSKQAEEALRTRLKQQKVISKLSAKALSGIDQNELFMEVVSEIKKVLKVDIVKILELQNEIFKIKAGVGLKAKYGIGYPIEVSNHTHAGYSLLHNEPILVTDLKNEKRFKGSKLLTDHKIISGISVIITEEGKPYGVLTAHSTKEKTFSQEDINFFVSTANLIALAIERKKVDRYLNLYQERYSHAQKAGQIGIFDWNLLNNSIWWSDEEYELLGYEPGEDIPNNIMSRHMHRDDLEKVRKMVKVAKEGKKDLSTEYRILTKDGSIKWLRAKSKVYFDRKGNPVRMLGVNYDVTERKRTEDSMFFLSEATKVLSSSLDYHKTLKAVASIAVPSIADWCSIDFLREDGEIELKTIAHTRKEMVEWAVKYREQNPPKMTEKTGLPNVIKTGKSEFYPYVDPILFKDLKSSEKAVLKKIGGITAVIIVPLKNKKKVIGALTLVTSESMRRFNEMDLKIAEQIADRASLAIENASLYQNVNEERKRLTHLLFNVPGIVWERWLVPSGERVNFVSNYIQKMLGYSSEEWGEKNDFYDTRSVHPKDRHLVITSYKEMFKIGKGGVLRFRCVTKKGKVIWVESHIYVISNDNGKPLGMRGVTMDISDRVEMERRKDEFISMASHELKTPLTSMKVFSHLLEKKIAKQNDITPYLSRMDEQINKLTNLVNDLLDISKIQAGKLEIRRQQIRLRDFVDGAIGEMKMITDEEILAEDVDDEIISADKERLSQVLMNLISNAIKYSPPNTPVEVKAKVEEGKVIFSVSDKGYGISKEHQDKIFDRFYRVYDNVDRTYPGLGMGLYISNQIVKRHKGSMWLESQKGKGSTFYFSVPSKLSN